MKSTISNLAAAHLAWMELRRSPATVQFYRYAYRRLEQFLATRPEQTFVQWAPLLAETGVCAVTVKHYLSALCTLASWSVKEGYLRRSPLERYTPIKATPAVVPGYRLEEVAAMAKCCNRATLRGRRHLAMLLFLDSGLRVSELCALTIGDLQRVSTKPGQVQAEALDESTQL